MEILGKEIASNGIDLKISEIIEMQNILHNKMKNEWLSRVSENGHFSLLWMFEEMGELVAIIKKRSSSAIMNNITIRNAFIEELSDVLMYFVDVLSCYDISSDEFSKIFIEKHNKNMKRDFVSEHQTYLSSEDKTNAIT